MAKDKSEDYIAKRLKGNITRGSGAIRDDADIRIDEFLIEVKRRSNQDNKVILYPKFWEKLRKQCVKYNKMPLYAYNTANDYYFITYVDSFYWIENKVEYIIEPKRGQTLIFRKENLNSIYSKANSIAIFEWNKIKYTILPITVLEEIINGQRKNEEIRKNQS